MLVTRVTVFTSAWCSRFYCTPEQMHLTAQAHILQSFMSHPGLPGLLVLWGRAAFQWWSCCALAAPSTERMFICRCLKLQLTNCWLITNLNDVSGHLTCTIQKKKTPTKHWTIVQMLEGEGWGHRRRIWLKHWNNIDWRSVLLAGTY